MATLKQRLIDFTNTLVIKLNLLNSQILAIPDSIPLIQKGAVNGVATLDSDGRVPSTQLPSYVDDIVDLIGFVSTNPTSGMVAGQKRYNSTTKKIFTSTSASAGTSITPESDKIYVNTSENSLYRWSGTVMVNLVSGNGSLALGVTASTAFQGDLGQLAYTHSQLTSGNPHNVTKAQVGLGNVDNTSDADKPLSTATVAAISGKADDNSVVKIAGTQTITGSKTFSLVPKSAQDASATTDLVRKSQFDAGLALQENKLPVAGSAGLVLTSTVGNGRAWTSFPSGVTNFAELNDRVTGNLLVNNGLTSALALKANDNTVVKITGTQTIAGQKNFTTSPTTNSDATAANDIPRKSQMDAAIKVVQDDLGTGDINYAAQLTAGLNF